MTTKDEALKLALEALEDQRIFTMRPDHEGKELTPEKVTNAITAVREALASEAKEQPRGEATLAQQEPVACANGCRGFVKHSPPAQRTWVHATEWRGLTDEERQSCTQSPFTADNYRAIEAKLKEKNT